MQKKQGLKKVLRVLGIHEYGINHWLISNVPLSRAVEIVLDRKGVSISYESGKTGRYDFVNDYCLEILRKNLGNACVTIA